MENLTADQSTSRQLHDLKTWPMYFQAVWDHRKPFEVRKDDRGFREGDVLRLREWNPETGEYTGRDRCVTVGYVLREFFEHDPSIVVMAIRQSSAMEAIEAGAFEDFDK